jgi:hypothetical protein
MRPLSLLWGLAVVCANLLAQPVKAQNAPFDLPQPAPGQFAFLVCNKSGLTLFFAFMHRASVTDSTLHVTGWFQVNVNECPHVFPINFPQGKFYYFANGWKADRTPYLVQGNVFECVTLPDAFDRSEIGNATCNAFPRQQSFSPGNYLAGFTELLVPPAVPAIMVWIKPP